jgi:hypothetical protein
MTEPANDERSDPHALNPPKLVDMEFVQALPDAKRIALLTVLIRPDSVDSLNFRSQVAFIRDALEQYPEAGIKHRDIGGALGHHHHSIQQQFRKLGQRRTQTGVLGFFLPLMRRTCFNHLT